MKLFQQLLVAPAALGLLAPVAAIAAEFNLDGVNKYASEEQVTSISQFSDVKPTDWAYQALSNLIERYGCVAGYPDGTYKGGKAMTRFEAAALLNACLDRVTEVTDELKRLMAEFEKELAVLKGRVDGLEAKVGELEANQFSTTTKLKGQTSMVVGGGANTGFGDEVTFNYDVRLNLDTSFNGKDLLRTTLRAGNFAESAFGNISTILEAAFQEDPQADTVSIDRLFYQFPIGDSWTATVGAKVRQDNMLAMWPSVYPADTVLGILTYAGSPAAYNLNLGGGIGLWYQKNGFSLSASYVSNELDASDSTTGIGEGLTATFQAGYAAERWGMAFVYSYNDFGAGSNTGGYVGFMNEWNALGLSGYWQPSEASWMPSVSAGFGYNDADTTIGDQDIWSWMVGLQWVDAFVKGNVLGMAIGTAGQIGQGSCGTALCPGGLWAEDGEDTLAYELWYKFQVTDNITVTPAFFYIEMSGADDTYGGLIKTTFRF